MVAAPQAIGKPHSLWCAFAKFYEKHGDVVNARVIFDKATQVRRFRCDPPPPPLPTDIRVWYPIHAGVLPADLGCQWDLKRFVGLNACRGMGQ